MHIDPQEQRRRVATPTPQPVVDEVSAGGVVVDDRPTGPHVAVIARRNRGGRLEWCLPKGHLEGEETAEEAAVREIAEETGIDGVVRRPLGTIDYWFSGDTHRVHKVVHHFLLDAVGGHLTIENDPDHEAEDVAWVPMHELGDRLAYPNERRLVAAAQDILAGLEARFVRGTVSRAARPRPRPHDENGTDAP